MGYSNQELFSQGGAGLVPEYYESHPNDSRVTGPHPIAGTDSARYGTGGGNTPLVSEYAMSLTAPVRRQDAETETLVPVVGQLMANTHPGSYSGQDAYTGHLLPVVESRLLMSFQSSELRLNGTLTDTGDLAPTLKSETKSGDSELRLLVQTVNARQDPDVAVEHVGPLDTDGGSHAVFAFESCVARNGRGAPSDLVPPLKAQSGETVKGDAAPLVAQAMQVRRLTPTECERLQGFPDGHTLIPWRGKSSEDCPDGPRYKALGNSMAVPVMHWIGKRIQLVEGL